MGGALTINAGGDLHNTGSLGTGRLLALEGSLENDGYLGSSSMLDVAGSLSNSSGNTVTVESVTLENDCTINNSTTARPTVDDVTSTDGSGTINNYGNMTIENGAEWWDVAWVTVGGNMQNYGTMQTSGMLDVTGSPTNNGQVDCGTLTVEYGGKLYNEGTVEMEPWAGGLTVQNGGYLQNDGTLNSYGALTVAGGADLDNNGAMLVSYSTAAATLESGSELDNGGTLTVADGASLYNSGTLANSGQLNVNGSYLENDGTLDDIGSVAIDSGGTVSTSGPFIVESGGTVSNLGALVNDDAGYETGQVFQINGTLDNGGTLTLDDEAYVFNYGLLENPGTMALDSNAGIGNYGAFNNFGALGFDTYGRLENDGTMGGNFCNMQLLGTPVDLTTLENDGILSNDGTITSLEATMTTLGSSSATFNYLDSVTLTAAVAGDYLGTPSGTVDFYDGGNFLGNASLLDGTATFTTSAVAAGSRNLTAVYEGDDLHLASTSATVNVSVVPLAITNLPTNNTISEDGTAALQSILLDDNGDAVMADSSAWTVDDVNGETVAPGDSANFTFTPPDSGAYDITLTATLDGTTYTATQTINVKPEVAITGPTAGVAGTEVDLTAAPLDPSAVDATMGFTYNWNVTKNGTAFTSGYGPDIAFTPDTAGDYELTVNGTDGDDVMSDVVTQDVTVTAAPSNVSIAASVLMASEAGQSPSEFTLTRDGDTSVTLPVSLTLTGGTVGTDFTVAAGTGCTLTTSGNNVALTFTAGSATATVEITPLDTGTVGGNLNITAALVSNSAYVIDSNNNSATVTIDDDDLPAVNIVASEPNATESGTPGQFTVTRNAVQPASRCWSITPLRPIRARSMAPTTRCSAATWLSQPAPLPPRPP